MARRPGWRKRSKQEDRLQKIHDIVKKLGQCHYSRIALELGIGPSMAISFCKMAVARFPDLHYTTGTIYWYKGEEK
jgi:hypothetical protein